jgi:hypothetical protein
MSTQAYASLPLLLLALTSCSLTPRSMQVPEALATSPEWVVEDWYDWDFDQTMRFGEYEVHSLDRSGTRPRGGVVDGIAGNVETRFVYTFRVRSLQTGSDLWEIECDTRDIRQSRPLPENRGVTVEAARTLFCDLESLTLTPGSWGLHLGARAPELPTGFLAQGETQYPIAAAPREGGSRTGTFAGYVLGRSSAPLAAIELVDRGSVRVDPALPESQRHLVAAVAASLLLQNKLLES